MNANKGSAQKLLIVGGTSSLASRLIQKAIGEGFQVHATFRSSTQKAKDLQAIWWELDLSSSDSVEEFLLSIKELSFSRIIYLAGESSGLDVLDFSETQINDYLNIQLLKPIYFLSRLVDQLETSIESNFIFLSSRSAIHGSADSLYGVAKAGIQNYLKSVSKEYRSGTSFISVVTGLIVGSQMQQNMGPALTHSHIQKAKLAGGDLLNVEEVTELIWAISPIRSSHRSGDIFMLGVDY